MVSELVSNAFRHGDGRIELTVESSPDGMWASVRDEGGGTIATPDPRPARGGWGLYFVERLSDAWGVAMAEGVLGNIKTAQGDYDAAVVFLERSLRNLVALDDHWGVATVLLSLARTETARGHFEQAVRISGSIVSKPVFPVSFF